MILFLVLLVLALAGGQWGHSRYGYGSWSPAGIVVLIGVILFFTGHLNLH